MAGDDDNDDDSLAHLFHEPEGYLAPGKPFTFETVRLESGQELTLRLVGHNPLWGHLLWNAARVLASYLGTHARTLVIGKTILEVGAGAGLPSLVCVSLGARCVVVTDYPDADLIDNLQHNIDTCSLLTHEQKLHTIHPRGHIWGGPVEPLLAPLGHPTSGGETPSGTNRFDTLLLADTLFNHSTHTSLLHTIRSTLARTSTARVLVFFTPHRPWLIHKDLAFFGLAMESGFVVRRMVERWYDEAMFEGQGKWEGRKPPVGWEMKRSGANGGGNDGNEEKDLRRVVWGYEMAWADCVSWGSSLPSSSTLPALEATAVTQRSIDR